MSDPSVAEELRGMGWLAKRVGDRANVSTPYGLWDAGVRIYSIGLAEFERLRADPAAADEILREYEKGGGEGEGWTATWWGRCIVGLRSSHFPDSQAFVIPREAFDRLEDDPTAFDEIHRAHRDNHA